MSSYSREIEAVLTATGKNCIVLPGPTRGELQRLIVKQVGGTSAGFSGQVLDRRGACENEIDLNVKGGAVASLANDGGFVQIEVGEGHNLLPGDQIYVKGTANAAVDGITHTITSVATTTVTTSTAWAGATGTGYWQTPPLDAMPIRDPEMHVVYEFAAQVAGTTFKDVTMEEQYENRDNQDVTARRRTSQLYLELDVDQANTTWQVSYTCAVPSAYL